LKEKAVRLSQAHENSIKHFFVFLFVFLVFYSSSHAGQKSSAHALLDTRNVVVDD
jgi:hypothetical protein